MSTSVARPSMEGGERWAALLALGLVAVWSGMAIAMAIPAIDVPRPPFVGAAVLKLIPLVVVGSVVLRRRAAPPPVALATAWMGILAGGLHAAVIIVAYPSLALAVPAAALGGLLVWRFPATSVAVGFALAASFGSLIALTAFPVGKATNVLLSGLWVALALRILLTRRTWTPFVWPGVGLLGLYVSLTFAEIATAPTLLDGLNAFRTSTWYTAAALAIAYAGWTREIHERIAKAIVIVCLLAGGYAVLRWIIGPAAGELAFAQQSDGGYLVVSSTGKLRVFGSFAGGHQLAVWMAIVVPFCFAFALCWRGAWRWTAAVACVLCTSALLGSGVRTALVAVVLGVVLCTGLIQVTRSIRGPHLGLTAAALAAALAVTVLGVALSTDASDGSVQRYSAILTPGRDLAFQQRVYKWRTVIAEIDDHPFGEGLGTGRDSARVNPYTTTANIGFGVDNGYLVIALEQGFAVMALFIAALLLVVVGLAGRAVMALDRHSAGLAAGGAASLLAFGIMLLTGIYQTEPTALAAWIITGLGAAGTATSSSLREPFHAADAASASPAAEARAPAPDAADRRLLRASGAA